MALLTTTIGAYPKPEYISVPDWFPKKDTDAENSTEAYNKFLQARSEQVTQLLDQATREIVEEQVRLGIDIPTDGELRRENYIHYHCRHLAGIDFGKLTEKVMRDGSWLARVPTITERVRAKEHFLIRDWQIAQSVTNRPICVTIPGPLTISDSLANEFYADEGQLCQDLADALNFEILALAEAGCREIQIDEPLLARIPETSPTCGVGGLERGFYDVPQEVTRRVHICCGYPDRVDHEEYHKASPSEYFRLAPLLDEAKIDAVSIEDAHCHNDLALLEQFQNTTVILGVIAIARSQIEPVEEIKFQLQQALEHIDAERLIVAPDCGLGLLEHEIVVAKLDNMVLAAKSVS